MSCVFFVSLSSSQFPYGKHFRAVRGFLFSNRTFPTTNTLAYFVCGVHLVSFFTLSPRQTSPCISRVVYFLFSPSHLPTDKHSLDFSCTFWVSPRTLPTDKHSLDFSCTFCFFSSHLPTDKHPLGFLVYISFTSSHLPTDKHVLVILVYSLFSPHVSNNNTFAYFVVHCSFSLHPKATPSRRYICTTLPASRIVSVTAFSQ